MAVALKTHPAISTLRSWVKAYGLRPRVVTTKRKRKVPTNLLGVEVIKWYSCITKTQGHLLVTMKAKRKDKGKEFYSSVGNLRRRETLVRSPSQYLRAGRGFSKEGRGKQKKEIEGREVLHMQTRAKWWVVWYASAWFCRWKSAHLLELGWRKVGVCVFWSEFLGFSYKHAVSLPATH